MLSKILSLMNSVSYLLFTSKDGSSPPPPQYSCLNQCTYELAKTQTHLCETEMCAHNVSMIPNIYSYRMLCVQGGEGVSDPNVVDTKCQVLSTRTGKGLEWSIVVKNGSLCKAICYNVSALVTVPNVHPIVETFNLSSDSGRDGKYHALTTRPDEGFCSLVSTDVDRTAGAAAGSNVSGNCDLEYVRSQSTLEMVPALRATTSPETTAKASCGAECIYASHGIPFRNMTKLSNDGQWVTFENCPFCSLYHWNAVLPVPDARDKLPQCSVTRNNDNKWILQKSDGDYVDCSAHCYCHTSPNDRH